MDAVPLALYQQNIPRPTAAKRANGVSRRASRSNSG